MRMAKKVMVIFLMLLCLLSNYNVIYVQAVDSPVSLIERVERYTSNYNEEEIKSYFEKGEYQAAIKLVEDAKDGYRERWDYIGLTTNDMYIAYQFKEYMTDDFFSKGWWANVTSWFSGLFYNDELKEYLSLQSPGVNKYKEALIYFMQETMDDLVYKKYVEELKYSIESIGEVTKGTKNVDGLSSQFLKDAIIDEDAYDMLYDMLLKAGSKEDVDKIVLDFFNANTDFFTNGSATYLFKNNLSKLKSKISNSLTFLGAGIEYIDTTLSGIMEIDFFVANAEVLTYYEDFLENIQFTKYDSGNYVAPEDLRTAAEELQQELEGNFFTTITNIINEYGITTALTGAELFDLLGKGILAEISLGIDICSMFGNAYLDMASLVKGVSYVQGYAYAGEIYSIVLKRDKDIFLKEKTEENAQQFRKDYEILWNIRLIGENSYIDMSDFSETWKKSDQKLLKKWTDYEEKEQFIQSNIEMIEGFKFKNPDFIKNSHSTESFLSNKQLNIFLSDIYDNGIWKYDANDYDISSLMFFAFKFVEGNHTPLYENEIGNYYYIMDYDTINDTIYKYFDIIVPHEQIEYILYQDNKFYFPAWDYEEWSRGFVIANNVEQISENDYKVTFDVADIWYENFDTGELNPIKDWNIYYDYGIDQMKADPFCEMLGSGYAILEQNGENLIVTEFCSDVERSAENSESVMPLTEEEAYKKVEEYWKSLGYNMPEEVEYEGLTESGHCFWGYNMIGDRAVTHFWICVDENTGQITVEGGIYREQ